MLHEFPTLLVTLTLFVTMVTVREFAAVHGARLLPNESANAGPAVVATTGATLGLLGLMLAFSFSMAEARYEARKTLLLGEANAMIRIDRRAELLRPEPRERLFVQLRRYGEARIALSEHQNDTSMQRPRALAEATLREAWPLVVDPSHYIQPRDLSVSILGAAIIDLLRVAGERDEALANRVPGPVLWMLFAMATLASAAVGFCFGASRKLGRVFGAGFALLVCGVIHVCLDLDSPQAGLMRLDTAPLLQAVSIIGP